MAESLSEISPLLVFEEGDIYNAEAAMWAAAVAETIDYSIDEDSVSVSSKKAKGTVEVTFTIADHGSVTSSDQYTDLDSMLQALEETDNVEVVHDKLMVLSGKLVTETVDNIIAGTVTSVPQDHFKDVPLTPAPKIFRETCRIDWNQPTKRIYDFIRGLSPYPAAWTTLEGKSVKIYEAETLSALTGISPVNGESHTGCVPGTISLVKSPHGLCVATADGWLNIKTLQLEGKKKMPVTDLLRGLKIKENAFFV